MYRLFFWLAIVITAIWTAFSAFAAIGLL